MYSKRSCHCALTSGATEVYVEVAYEHRVQTGRWVREYVSEIIICLRSLSFRYEPWYTHCNANYKEVRSASTG